ncbi:MAG: DUF1592 domain-containing protein, partial [Planctomycetota bacterium]
ASATQAGDEPAKMHLEADQRTLRQFDVSSQREDPQTFVVRFRAESDQITAAAAFVNDYWDPSAEDRERRDRNLYVSSIALVGPTLAFQRSSLPESHQRLLPWSPDANTWSNGVRWVENTRNLLRKWARRAYRRPAVDIEVERLESLVALARERGDSFERAMQQALQALLVSPAFLFRGEPADDAERGIHPVSPYQLATRLSYFLWSSTPDDRLLDLVQQGALRRDLDSEIDRLLADPRSDRLVRNFGEQWLETRRLASLERTASLFPEFDADLAAAMREETFLFLRDLLRTEAPLTTLLNADSSFVNARLGRHYGVEVDEDGGFQRIALPPKRQLGLLGHAGILAVTSYDDRTSPVIRGKWVLDHLLNDPPPPPPPDVPELAEPNEEEAHATLRERLELHRANAVCASCHKRMDALGFALENFDAVGKWRDRDGESQIDASGTLPDGRAFDGPTQMRDLLLADFDRVRRALAEQLLTFALGRGLEHFDHCTVNQIVAETIDGGDTLASLIRAIIHSPAFQQRNESQQ